MYPTYPTYTTYPYFFPISRFKRTNELESAESLDNGLYVSQYEPDKTQESTLITPYHSRVITNIPSNIQNSCLELQIDGPPPLQILGAEILRLQHETLALQEKQVQFQKAVALHMDNLYQLVAQELYKLIKNDPVLINKIKADLSRESDLTVSALFCQTEKAVEQENEIDELSSDWVEVEKDGSHQLIDIDNDLVDLLKSQVETLTKFSLNTSETNQQLILQDVAHIEKNLPKKPSLAWIVTKGTMTGITTLFWYVMKTTVLVAHSAVIMAPTVAIMMPMIAPTSYLKLLLYLINLLQK